MSKRIKKTKASKIGGSGIEAIKPKPQGISFSFKYYQDKHQKFSCAEKTAVYVVWLDPDHLLYPAKG